MNNNKYIMVFIFLLNTLYSSITLACTSKKCDNLVFPSVVKKYIEDGFSEVKVDYIFNAKYLLLTSNHDVNKCSILFEIKDRLIKNTPILGGDGKLCNLSILNNIIISSWRDKGVWSEDIYKIEVGGTWNLLFNDRCIGCQQVKRSIFKNGEVYKTALLSDGDDFSSRKNLSGKIEVVKSFLYSSPNEQGKIKAYLVKGDSFMLLDMSDNGEYYKIEYKSSSGKKYIYWIKSDDFSFN